MQIRSTVCMDASEVIFFRASSESAEILRRPCLRLLECTVSFVDFSGDPALHRLRRCLRNAFQVGWKFSKIYEMPSNASVCILSILVSR